ncbi:hypothetical protein Tco_0672898 [Tanacetum coccineum]
MSSWFTRSIANTLHLKNNDDVTYDVTSQQIEQSDDEEESQESHLPLTSGRGFRRRGVELDEEGDAFGYNECDSGAASDDFDLLELGETGEEFCQIGDQTYSIPFELYHLSVLEDILCMDFWNNVLSFTSSEMMVLMVMVAAGEVVRWWRRRQRWGRMMKMIIVKVANGGGSGGWWWEWGDEDEDKDVLLILIIPEKYASFKDPFMVLIKHQEAGIKDLMRKSKGLDLLKILMSHVYIKRIWGKQHLFLESKSTNRSKRLIGHGASTPKEVKDMQNVPYASAVGSIMYAVRCTRPDVAFAQNITSRFQQNPGESHWTAVKNILKYLRNIKDMFLVYGGNPEAELRVDCYCNAGFEIDIDDMKSLTGYLHKLNYIAASEAEMEAVWIRKFISGLDDNLADPFTKALPKGKLTQHARSMRLRLASSFM